MSLDATSTSRADRVSAPVLALITTEPSTMIEHRGEVPLGPIAHGIQRSRWPVTTSKAVAAVLLAATLVGCTTVPTQPGSRACPVATAEGCPTQVVVDKEAAKNVAQTVGYGALGIVLSPVLVPLTILQFCTPPRLSRTAAFWRSTDALRSSVTARQFFWDQLR
jgi:hypothetical protein